MAMVKKRGDGIVFEYAHREGDFVYLDVDGLDSLRNLLGLARLRRQKAFEKETVIPGGYTEQLLFADKVLTGLFESANEVRVKIAWDKWEPIEKRINAEMRRMNR